VPGLYRQAPEGINAKTEQSPGFLQKAMTTRFRAIFAQYSCGFQGAIFQCEGFT
jgi:hypothetical protein